MRTIVSKIQYKDSEPGEFVDEKIRTLEESISLIKDFPWENQRINRSIGLTNPSLTFEKESNNYLKLAPFYSGHFVLYFLNEKKQLFIKSGLELQEACKAIQHFFEEEDFDISTFKRKKSISNNFIIHFATRAFKYEIKGTFYFLKNILYSSAMPLHFMALLCFISFSYRKGHFDATGLIYLIFYFVLVCIGRLYFYSSSKGKILVLSKGNETFQYGNAKLLNTYYKKDIAEILIPGPKKGFGFENCLYKIDFKDGGSLFIPDLILQSGKFVQKFPYIKARYINY